MILLNYLFSILNGRLLTDLGIRGMEAQRLLVYLVQIIGDVGIEQECRLGYCSAILKNCARERLASVRMIDNSFLVAAKTEKAFLEQLELELSARERMLEGYVDHSDAEQQCQTLPDIVHAGPLSLPCDRVASGLV